MSPKTEKRAPALFLGHGSPMNAIDHNAFTQSLNGIGQRLGSPRAVVCISAHWLSAGTWVTHVEAPRTIHDFHGFPKALFDVRYPAPGDPPLAEQIKSSMEKPRIKLDDGSWGLDHGTWSVLRHVFPKANVPVVQLSLDMSEPPDFHFELGKKLRFLRDEGVVIVGSGNIVHNLREIRWKEGAEPWEWAVEFDEWAKEKIAAKDFKPLVDDFANTEAGKLSIPTLDHYLPLLHVLGAAADDEAPRFEYEAIELGSLSMRSVSFGLA